MPFPTPVAFGSALLAVVVRMFAWSAHELSFPLPAFEWACWKLIEAPLGSGSLFWIAMCRPFGTFPSSVLAPGCSALGGLAHLPRLQPLKWTRLVEYFWQWTECNVRRQHNCFSCGRAYAGRRMGVSARGRVCLQATRHKAGKLKTDERTFY